MKVLNITEEQMKAALADVNLIAKNNIQFKKLKPAPQGFHALLSPIDLNGTGVQYSMMPDFKNKIRRPIQQACWHVYNQFFKSVFLIEPNAIILNRNSSMYMSYGELVGKGLPDTVGIYKIPLSLLCLCQENNICNNKETILNTKNDFLLCSIQKENIFYIRAVLHNKPIKFQIEWEPIIMDNEVISYDVHIHDARVIPFGVKEQFKITIKQTLKESFNDEK